MKEPVLRNKENALTGSTSHADKVKIVVKKKKKKSCLGVCSGIVIKLVKVMPSQEHLSGVSCALRNLFQLRARTVFRAL